jgi:REP element-mobilizing transposase RayT
MCKVVLNNTVIAITTTMEEGLYLPPNPLMKSIIEGHLARAQHLHPVRINHFLFESNHFHMIITVDNPSDITGFMGRLKTELAHAINRLMGRKKRTIWCESFHGPPMLTLEDVMDWIVYLYTNPAKDGLERTINLYPGLSSFAAWQGGEKKKKSSPWINRNLLRPLSTHVLSQAQYAGIARSVKEKAKASHTFEVFPDDWMEVFGVTDEQHRREINKETMRRLRAREEMHERERLARGYGVIGAERLVAEPMNKPYLPAKRKGKKMWCICRDVEMRKRFIAEVKRRVRIAREVFKRWQIGDFSVEYPPGLYPPSMPKRVEALGFC